MNNNILKQNDNAYIYVYLYVCIHKRGVKNAQQFPQLSIKFKRTTETNPYTLRNTIHTHMYSCPAVKS